MKKNSQSGQVLLITLLVLSFAAIIVLSLIARTTTTQKITTQIDDSAKALSAAEAGLELALQSHSGAASNTEPGVSFVVTSPAPIANGSQYTLREKTPKGGLAVVWLSPHAVNGSNYELQEDDSLDFDGNKVDVCWSDDRTTDPSKPPAIIATLLYKKLGEYKVGKIAFDSNSGTQGFEYHNPVPNDCSSRGLLGQDVKFNDLISGGMNDVILLALRMRPVYNPTQFSVFTFPKELPAQGYIYTSTGTTASGTTRSVQVEEMFPAPGAIFDYVVYSQTGDFQQ